MAQPAVNSSVTLHNQLDVTVCPLCRGKRHRKSGDTWTECAWRQFVVDVGIFDELHEVPLMIDPELIHEYADWLAANLHAEHVYLGNVVFPGLLAGSTDANRILRQRARGDI